MLLGAGCQVVVEYYERSRTNQSSNVIGQDDTSIAFSSVSDTSESKPDQTESSKAEEDEDEASATPETEPASSPSPNAKEESSRTTKKSTDPLRWFGILVPPALRAAQQSFISVVEEGVPLLATIAKELRSQEIEIGRVRKQMKKL